MSNWQLPHKGINENLTIMLMAAKFGVPVCPHAGGVGLCEYIQHLPMTDYISISGTVENRMIKFVDHLYGHFKTPGNNEKRPLYAPKESGFSIKMKRDSLAAYSLPAGKKWMEMS